MKIDLRYTVLRAGKCQLMVPNSAFVTREFLVYDAEPSVAEGQAGLGDPFGAFGWGGLRGGAAAVEPLAPLQPAPGMNSMNGVYPDRGPYHF